MTFLIRKALEEDKIVCFYQPIVDNQTQKIVKYETLVRLSDNGKIIPPNEFLPIVKTTKLYSQITKTVLKKACEKFKNIDKKFSVNISIDDIEDDETVEYIIDTIKNNNLGNKIIFEILETEGIENYSKVEKFIDNIKKLNAEFAIDDFGSGYSNFKHILSLKVDYIKIDGSLIKDVVKDKKSKIIIETIVNFAKKMGAKTIAEYVSSKEIFEEVKKLGIDCSQGYYFGKPSPEI
jgi:EAL domain-containing protein (putative c-di-GMP-specific phosphodiesterase class I)